MAKECSTPNSTPLVGVLFVVYSFKSFGDWSAESSTKWSAKTPRVDRTSPLRGRRLLSEAGGASRRVQPVGWE